MSDIVIFIVVLAVLVLAHEFGHFIAARRKGVRVEEFGFGFPPRLFGFQKGETFYSFNLLPLGGFVKISGENDVDSSDPRNFASHGVRTRASILSAGVFFNIILAFIIFSSAVSIGMPVDAGDPLWSGRVRDKAVTVVEILPESAAETAGLIIGDKILSLEADAARVVTTGVSDVHEFTVNHAGRPIKIEIDRNGQKNILSAVLSENKIAPLGVATAEIGKIDVPWYKIPWVGLELTFLTAWRTLGGFFHIFQMLFSGQSVAGFISGPVGIFSIVSGSIDMGLAVIMSLVAVLSINLAIINLIPIPGLDGGHLLFLAVEAARGRPVGRKISGLAHAAGFAILIMLMLVVTYLDIKLRL